MTEVECPKCGKRGTLTYEEKNETRYYRVYHKHPSEGEETYCWLGTKESIQDDDSINYPLKAYNGEREMRL